MNYSFEYIDIILLAMIAGFIFLRLRGILGKKTGHEEDVPPSFAHDFEFKKPKAKEEIYNFYKTEIQKNKDDIKQIDSLREEKFNLDYYITLI